MKNVSSDFRNELNDDNRNYVKSADITLKNGTVIHVDNSDMWSNGLTIEDSTSGENSFDIGSVIIGSATLVLNNIDEDFSEYDFTDCVMSNVKVGLKLPDNTVESLAYGKYYLNEQKYNGSIITLTFYDGISKFDKDYSKSNLQYPATLLQIVQDACNVCGITLGTLEFEKDDYIVQTRPDDDSLTFRQVLQWVAQISCHYCKCDEQGRLCLEWYDTDTLEELTTTGEQTTTGDYHTVSSNSTFTVGLDDVVITGIRVLQDVEGENGTETITYQSGSDGYVLEISKNQFIQGDNGSVVAAYLASKLAGVRFRPFEISCLSDPTIEAGDIALIIDRKGNRYKSIITNNTFNPGNFQRIVCGAETPARQSASRYSQITQVYVDYRKDLQKEKTEREQAIEDLQDRVNNSSGLFTTTEEQPDGSNKFYLHNKPELSESDIIWTMTAEAWTVSTNGGVTVNGGMTVDGDTIVRILNAVGINADWINSGAISIKDADGNETFYADTVTGIVRINAQSFSLTGKTVEEIAAEQVNDFVENVYSPTITNLQNQIDGQIETWFEDYIPTNENYPANEWTTDTEKDKHLGDLFYVVDNEEYGGQAYRWALINGEYKWDYVEDTAVVKALADAAKAQDTADQKRRVFVSQPYPPYDVGDLWVGDSTSEMMRCQTARSTGSYIASDWIKAVKYTDDANLNLFINGTYADTVKELTEQLDKKAETWYQTTDPALNWTGTEEAALVDHEGNVIVDHEGNTIVALWEKEKAMHNGDLWKNPDTNVEYIYQDGKWIEMQIPNDVFDTIDGKAQIFVAEPTTPYDVGDLWFTGTEILVSEVKRDEGDFVSTDWVKKEDYTDDSALYEFIEGEYAQTIEDIKTQADQKAETWYQENDPAFGWTASEKAQHKGDLWYSTSDQKTYIYDGSQWRETKTEPPDEVFDQIDGKAQIFVSQPTPPYQVGDLWFNSSTSDIMTCIAARESGSYTASDWEKRNKYTDDSYAQQISQEFNTFLGEYQSEIEGIQNSIDKKAETWYQATDPSLNWTGTEECALVDHEGNTIIDHEGNTIVALWEKEKAMHEGDLWYDTNSGNQYIYQSGQWEPMEIPKDVFDTIDGKAQIFVSQPVPPYDIGDLWFNSATSDIMTCIQKRESGTYNAADWEKRNKYTDDTYAETVEENLNIFSEAVTGNLNNMQEQIDGKIETWYYNYQPTLANIPASQWTTEEERHRHIGDLFYWQDKGFTYRFQQGTNGYIWQPIQDSDITEALNQAAQAQDTADRKRQVFYSTPYPPYDVGDLWAQGANGDIMRCKTARQSGSYVSTDWEKASKYTDDTAVDNLDNELDQQGVFDRLTNNGQEQGVYLQNGRLYINGDYIQAGTISGNYIKGGTIEGTVYKYGDDSEYITIHDGRLFATDYTNALSVGVHGEDDIGIRIGKKREDSDVVEFTDLAETTMITNHGASFACKKGSLLPSITANGYVSIGVKNITGIDAFSPLFYSNSDTGESGWAVVSDSSNNYKFVFRTQPTGDSYLEIQTLFGAYGLTAWASDIRDKERIVESCSNGLETINKFKHRKFRWKDIIDGLSEKHEGFYVDCGYIAQEMQEINPQFVITVAKGTEKERLQINEQSIIPYITKAIQELSEENKALGKEIEEIKAILKGEN